VAAAGRDGDARLNHPRKCNIGKELMVELYESGCSLREVAEISGLSFNAVQNRLVNIYGVKMRPRGGNRKWPPHDEYAKTAFLYERMKLTVSEICEITGLHPSTIQNRLRQHGVTMRSPGESMRIRFARRPPGTPLVLPV
jgi:predicted HTH domain antitoxin